MFIFRGIKSYAAGIAAISLVVLCFTGCPEELDEDVTIDQITITGIPKQIQVDSGTDKNDTFKVYLNASDSQNEKDPPVAQGTVKVTDAMLNGDTYTITIKLRKPKAQPTPNADDGPWSGSAANFSVMISPNDTSTDKENAIWVKAGMPLDKGKEQCDWNSLIDFRGPMKTSMGLAAKTKALYDEVVCKDSEITTTEQ